MIWIAVVDEIVACYMLVSNVVVSAADLLLLCLLLLQVS